MVSPKNPPPDDLPRHVEHSLKSSIGSGGRLCVGLSGGVDSIALLDLLWRLHARLGFSLTAIHVNHGLSVNADAWEQFCRDRCAALSVPLRVERIDVPLASALGREAAARHGRYLVFRTIDADYLVLAHHLDDQAETVLLQLLRGAGLNGLSGMPLLRAQGAEPAVSELSERAQGAETGVAESLLGSQSAAAVVAESLPGAQDAEPVVAESLLRAQGAEPAGPASLLRPLLDVPRAVLLDYARMRGLQWIEDESNSDTGYDRNFVRHQLLPIIARRFPGCRNTLARAANHIAEAARLLDEFTAEDERAAVSAGHLSLAALRRFPPARAKNLLRRRFAQLGALPPSARRLEEMLRQLRNAGPESAVQIRCGGLTLRCFRDRVLLQREAGAPPRDWSLPWQGEPIVDLGPGMGELHFELTSGAGVSVEKLSAAPACIRLRRGGERLRVAANRPTRTLKNLLQENHVAPWQRVRLPLLFCGERLVWAPGVGTAHEFHAQRNEAGWRIEWFPAVM
jgi:tRNA(Ile)-lysidine synthase